MTNLILTGSTGFCGREVLRLALRSPGISNILVITRRPLPDELGSRKLRTIVHTDFTDYTSILPQINAFRPDACIWCLGGRRKNFATRAEFEAVTVNYTVAAAKAFADICAATNRRLRFIYLSGWGADVTERKWRPFNREDMYAKGRTESDLFVLSQKHPVQGQFELYTFRPGDPPENKEAGANGQVVPVKNRSGGGGVKEKLKNWMQPICPNDVLAAAMLGVSITGFGEEGVSVFFENREILTVGRDWLAKFGAA